MHIPEGMTEKEVLKAIEIVSNGLGPRYQFGYHGIDDMKQHATIFALQALPKYDPTRGGKLTTFLWTAVSRKLYNLRRDKYERLDKPCLSCPLMAYDPNCQYSDSECTEYNDKMSCELYANWYKRNSCKKNLMSPIGIGNVRDEKEDNMKTEQDVIDDIIIQDLVDKIDREIPVDVRPLWIKVKTGIKLKKKERSKLAEAIQEIEGVNLHG